MSVSNFANESRASSDIQSVPACSLVGNTVLAVIVRIVSQLSENRVLIMNTTLWSIPMQNRDPPGIKRSLQQRNIEKSSDAGVFCKNHQQNLQ